MIKAEERYLLLQAGFTERQINTQMQKFYNLFRVAPMPQMQTRTTTPEDVAKIKSKWVGLTKTERSELWWSTDMGGMPEHDYGKKVEALLKEKNNG